MQGNANLPVGAKRHRSLRQFISAESVFSLAVRTWPDLLHNGVHGGAYRGADRGAQLVSRRDESDQGARSRFHGTETYVNRNLGNSWALSPDQLPRSTVHNDVQFMEIRSKWYHQFHRTRNKHTRSTWYVRLRTLVSSAADWLENFASGRVRLLPRFHRELTYPTAGGLDPRSWMAPTREALWIFICDNIGFVIVSIKE